MARHHDDWHRQLTGSRPLFEQGDAISVRHPDIEQDEIDLALFTNFAGLGGTICQQHDVAFISENLGEQLTDADFIVDYEYLRHESYALVARVCSGMGLSTLFASFENMMAT